MTTRMSSKQCAPRPDTPQEEVCLADGVLPNLRALMFSFIARLWQLVGPYKARFFLGTTLGVLAGFREPLLLISVYVVFVVVFQDVEAIASLDQQISKLRGQFPQGAEWLNGLIHSMSAGPTMATALMLLSILPLTMLVGGLMNYGYVYCMQWVSIRAVGDLRAKLFDHLLHLPPGFLQKHSTGELMSRVSNDVNMLGNLMSYTLVSIVRDPITLLVLVVGILTMYTKLTLYSALILPVCLVPVIIFARKVRKSSEQTQTEQANLFKSMHEGLTGARVVKAYNLESIVVNNYRARQQTFYGRYMRMISAGEIPGPLIEFFGSVGVALLLAMIAVSDMKASTAGFLGFVGALQFIYTKIKVVVRLYNQTVQGQAASKRVFELLDTESDLREPAHPKPLNAANAPIEFENLSFGYDGVQLFDKFNLTVQPGQLVALVGQSGSGKTTLTNLLLRFYDPQGGAVKIGGVDIRETNSKTLRAQIAVVTQDTILFNESVRRNIELGRPGATLEEIKAAAKHAHAAEFIERKQNEGGYDMVIGEKGNTLSGGQKQRLAIARAILKDAPILILDEATSALDTESERAVQAALDELMDGRTTICIAHRLSTVQHADVIVVMDQGRIVEKGTHKELLEEGGLYQKLYQMQFREE